MMTGRYAGEIRDIRPVYARGLVDRGEAVDVNAPIREVVPEAPAAVVVKEVDDLAAKRHRRRV